MLSLQELFLLLKKKDYIFSNVSLGMALPLLCPVEKLVEKLVGPCIQTETTLLIRISGGLWRPTFPPIAHSAAKSHFGCCSHEPCV